MAGRPIKQRIDYSGWSVDMFDSDTKIDNLLDAQGWLGFSIYFYLCQRAYGSDGYFYRWSYADAATTARKMAGGIGSETVKQTVNACLQIGLFDNRLFAEGVLTSRGIQKRYWAVVSERPRKLIIPELWLLSEEEAPGCNKCMLKSNLSPINTNLSPINASLSALKESKVKESSSDFGYLSPINTNLSPINEIGDLDEEELELRKYAEINNAAEEAIESAWMDLVGKPFSGRDHNKATTLLEMYELPWILEAMDKAGDGNERSWRYIEGILRNFKAQGGPDSQAKRAQSPPETGYSMHSIDLNKL